MNDTKMSKNKKIMILLSALSAISFGLMVASSGLGKQIHCGSVGP